MVRQGVGVAEEEGIHTHIFSTETGCVVARAKGANFTWNKFFFFEAYGHQFPFSAMPNLRSYTLYTVLPDR